MEGARAPAGDDSPVRSRAPGVVAACLSLAYLIFLVISEYEPSTGFEIRTACLPGSTAEDVVIASYIIRLAVATGGVLLAVRSVLKRASLFGWALSVWASVVLTVMSGLYWVANCSA